MTALTPRRCDILDSAPETVFDDMARLASFIGKTPIGTFTLIDAHRQLFNAQVGRPVGKTERDAAFCGYTILDDVVLQVPDATDAPRFADNRLATGARSPPCCPFAAAAGGFATSTRIGRAPGRPCRPPAPG